MQFSWNFISSIANFSVRLRYSCRSSPCRFAPLRTKLSYVSSRTLFCSSLRLLLSVSYTVFMRLKSSSLRLMSFWWFVHNISISSSTARIASSLRALSRALNAPITVLSASPHSSSFAIVLSNVAVSLLLHISSIAAFSAFMASFTAGRKSFIVMLSYGTAPNGVLNGASSGLLLMLFLLIGVSCLNAMLFLFCKFFYKYMDKLPK